MRRIVITRPEFSSGEASGIRRMLDEGVMRVHIRKPGATESQMRGLLEAIPAEYRLRVSLHGCQYLAREFGIGGVHLNGLCPVVPAGFSGLVSRSCHSISELKDCSEDVDYAFLSPIFDSISKPGYGAAFAAEELRKAADEGIITETVFALGGVSASRFREIEALGFGGAALLGAAWNPVNVRKFRLQYIASGAEGVEKVLDGGCRWIQLRMKDARSGQILAEAHKIAPLCRRYGAVFLLDDRVELVEAAGADGVHLGKNDIPVEQARRMLGPGYIIGATANTLSDMHKASCAGAHYIGLGPLRFTTTKKNLSPTLGYEGYRDLTESFSGGIPIVAIGGITPDDIAPLADAGVQGVAVRGSISRAASPREATAEFIGLINRYFNN